VCHEQGVLSLPTQLGMFREYIGKLTALVGQQRAANIISNSVYLVSAGNNDIAITYSQILATTQPFPLYATRLIDTTSNFLKVHHLQTSIYFIINIDTKNKHILTHTKIISE